MSSNSNKQLKLIAVTAANHEALKGLGHMHQSFNDVITQLLKDAENRKRNQHDNKR
jgi:hypothetical protein